MARSINAQSIHDTLVRNQVATYQNQGCSNIKADHIGYPNGRPPMIGAHIPDVSAVCNGQAIICEVETVESINTTDTIIQWKAFDRSGYIFHVAVPRSALTAAQAMAQANSISVDKFWYNDNY